MNQSKSYAGIDYFRVLAALLIVAIHTSPLASVSQTGDYILTRILARVGVPFFFMTSGYFLVSRYARDAERLKTFVKNTLRIYGIAILIYIPINIYNGYFSMSNLLPNLLRDLVFDGTLYHLWYLPASVIGGVLAWVLVKKLNYPGAFAVTVLLYLVGLFGDSYFGIAQNIPILREFYELLFQVMSYTRNGIFFAPFFFLLGGWMADSGKILAPWKSLCGFGVGLVLMLAEAMTARRLGWQRFDSMLLSLLPCVFFLFQLLLCLKGKRRRNLRNVSLIVYIIHPMMIVAVRLAAKLLHLERLLVENSILHFLAVSLASVVFAGLAVVLWNRFRPVKRKFDPRTGRAWIEINLDNLTHNVKALQAEMPQDCQFMAVVKAEAYGHGAFAAAAHLNEIGVNAFAVATIDEAIALRRYGIRGEILILGYTDVCRVKEIKKYDLIQTVVSFDYAKALNEQGVSVKTHVKIDTGMHRLGIPWDQPENAQAVFAMDKLKISGIYTHLCCSDSQNFEDVDFTRAQIDRFYRLVDHLKESGIPIPKLHIQSSYGLLNYPELKCDYVRIGIALYGVLSTPDNDTKVKPDLRPVLTLKARVALIRSVCKGEGVGYNLTFTAERDSRIAILPIGYADGFPRNLSCGKGNVLLNGQIVPIVGRICMDQFAIDVTDIPDVSVGDCATLIGDQLSAPDIACGTDSISNELLCRMGARLPVVPVNGEQNTK